MRGKIPAEDKEPVRIWELVHAFCLKTGFAADKAWGMTVADLVLTLLPRKEEQNHAENRIEQMVLCARIDERFKLLDDLTIQERIELENFKASVMGG